MEFIEAIDFNSPWVLGMIVVAAIFIDDMTCLAVGTAVAAGEIELGPAMLACLLGAHLGDMAWFLAAHKIGQPLLERKPFSLVVTPEKIEQARGLFDRLGPWALFVSRFTPMVRTPLQITAGLLLRRVLPGWGLLVAAGGIYVVLVVGGMAWLGRLVDIKGLYKQHGAWGLLIVPVIVLAVIGVAKWLIRKKIGGKAVEAVGSDDSGGPPQQDQPDPKD